MRGIYVFLNGDRGAPVLERLHSAGHAVESAIVPEGKTPNGVDEICRAAGISVRPVRAVNDAAFLQEMQAARPELFVIAGFSAIFKRPLYTLPRLGTINLHAGRLPHYRGGSPLNWQMINGETVAGVSVTRVDDGIDTGPLLSEATFPIGPRDTIADLHRWANDLFPDLVLDAITQLERDASAGRVQDEAGARYWHQRSDNDGQLHPAHMNAVEVDRVVRALTRPYPGAFAYRGDTRVRIFAASVPDLTLCGVPGRVCWIQGRGPYLVCADRAIEIEDYVIEGVDMLRYGDHLG